MSDWLAEFKETEPQQQQPQQGYQQQAPQQNYQQQPQQQSYNNNNNYNKGGGYGGGGGQNAGIQAYIQQQKTVQDPYLPIVVFIERDFPQEVKDSLVSLVTILTSKGYTVRFNAEDFAIMDKITSQNGDKIEAHLPLSPFKNLQTGEERKSKFKNNSATTDHFAEKTFGPGWNKLKKFIQMLISRNARMLISTNNKSPAKFLITWSPDGATNDIEVSSDTGNVGTMIKMASALAIPTFNVNNEKSRDLMNKILLRRGNNNE